MRYCGSVDTVAAYERVKKQPQSPDHFNTRPVKGNNHVQDKDKRTRKNSSSPHHTITYKMQVNSDDEQAEAMEEVESLGKCLSYSPDAPKALGIASKRRVHSSRSSRRKGFDNKEPPLDTSREPHNSTSIAHLLVRYQSIVELSSSATSSTSSSSASPSSNSPHNNLILV